MDPLTPAPMAYMTKGLQAALPSRVPWGLGANLTTPISGGGMAGMEALLGVSAANTVANVSRALPLIGLGAGAMQAATAGQQMENRAADENLGFDPGGHLARMEMQRRRQSTLDKLSPSTARGVPAVRENSPARMDPMELSILGSALHDANEAHDQANGEEAQRKAYSDALAPMVRTLRTAGYSDEEIANKFAQAYIARTKGMASGTNGIASGTMFGGRGRSEANAPVNDDFDPMMMLRGNGMTDTNRPRNLLRNMGLGGFYPG